MTSFLRCLNESQQYIWHNETSNSFYTYENPQTLFIFCLWHYQNYLLKNNDNGKED